jgi:hypothetical protein
VADDIFPVEGPADWKGPAIDFRREGVRLLAGDEVDEIEAALAHLERGGEKDFPAITAADFPLPRFGEFLGGLGQTLRTGRGFLLLRGLPRARYSEDELAKIYFGMSAYIGTTLPQSWHGEVLGHVMDISDIEQRVRAYHAGGAQRFHTDSCDIIGLMCVRAAKSGGASRFTSAVAIHNEMFSRCPELLSKLYDGITFRRMEQDAEYGTGITTKKISVYARVEKEVSVSVSAQYAKRAVDAGDAPPDAVATEAMETLEAIAASPAFHLDMSIGEGDIQFLNNRLMVHGRLDYEDFPEINRRRHMMRLWLQVPGWPALPARQSNHTAEDYRGWLRQRTPLMELPSRYLERMARRQAAD